MSVEWRFHQDADTILLVDGGSQVESIVAAPDGAALKAYLAVTGNLARWQQLMDWRPTDGNSREPNTWGELVLSRAEGGEIIFLDPELFWERVYSLFRSRGVDYNTPE